ncbi:MAG: mechanosensitive ion channel family protein, partial [Candidatus Binatia bacterium]
MTSEVTIVVGTLGVLGAAAMLHFVLVRSARRLPRLLAARRSSKGVPGADLPWGRTIAAGFFAMRIALWLTVLRVLSDRFWILRGLRYRLEALVGMSLSSPLFMLGTRDYSAIDILTLLALLGAVWVGMGFVARSVRTHLLRATGADRGVQEAVTILLRYGLSLLGTIVVLQAWGIDMSSLTIVASVLGVGIGFGLQHIANNFVSGLLVALERPVKAGDFVQVGEFMGTVKRVGTRSTEIRTLDAVSILVPNSRLLEQEVVNWSHGDAVCRLHVPVSIEYGADLRRARAAMLEVARAHPEVLDDPRPTVELRSFGASGIEMELLVWTREPRRQHTLRSELNLRVFETFAAHSVSIPFPQQD